MPSVMSKPAQKGKRNHVRDSKADKIRKTLSQYSTEQLEQRGFALDVLRKRKLAANLSGSDVSLYRRQVIADRQQVIDGRRQSKKARNIKKTMKSTVPKVPVSDELLKQIALVKQTESSLGSLDKLKRVIAVVEASRP